MFDWLKRRAGAGAAPKQKAASGATAKPKPGPARAGNHQRFLDTAPLPEVVAEGNTQADWSAWEDSMTALDSQMQGLVPSTRIYVRETRPSQLDELDAYSGVKRKRDV
jgi:hypothetical protein